MARNGETIECRALVANGGARRQCEPVRNQLGEMGSRGKQWVGASGKQLVSHVADHMVVRLLGR